MTSLAELLRLVDVVADAPASVSRVVHDSRAVAPGDVFVALAPDARGAEHAREARARGAAAVVASSQVCDGAVVVSSPALFLARAAEHLAGHPTSSLPVVGITGTNGKSTTTRLVHQALGALGARPALVGTSVLTHPGGTRTSAFTTPFADALSGFAREALDAGATHLAMEVSSHALDQRRVDGLRFAVAGFTNLTQDHLDYHPSMEAYGAAKARLFHELAPGASVVHVGDAFGAALARTITRGLCTVAVDAPADVHAVSFDESRDGLVAELSVHGRRVSLRSPLVGRHNLENLLVATGSLVCLGFDAGRVVAALADATGAEGRLERVADPDVAVYVDYAHSEDALRRVLAALRPSTEGRLLVVFGCGGDRDRGKRPRMGAAAAELADVVVVTSDNPRTESPTAIVDEILPGIPSTCPALTVAALAEATRGHVVVLDRRAAIGAAIAAARPTDTVLIAGKGHETEQIVGTTRTPFDDRVEAARALAHRRNA